MRATGFSSTFNKQNLIIFTAFSSHNQFSSKEEIFCLVFMLIILIISLKTYRSYHFTYKTSLVKLSFETLFLARSRYKSCPKNADSKQCPSLQRDVTAFPISSQVTEIEECQHASDRLFICKIPGSALLPR